MAGCGRPTDFGRTWTPIFDQKPTGSIGAIEVAPSDPNVIYVGSGEGLHRPDLSVGDGIYKSTDGGATWTHLGLRDGQQISQMAIDPHDPNRLFVAVAGHPYGPNPGARHLSFDRWRPDLREGALQGREHRRRRREDRSHLTPNIVYATLWEAREGPWENGEWNGTGGGIFKSTDGGQTWHPLAGGLPDGIVQAYVAIARSNPKRLFASVATKDKVELYRSPMAATPGRSRPPIRVPRPASAAAILPVPMIDPKNPDVIYMASIVTWKSTDGGKTWTGFRGAPGGDDYQNIWINPNDSNTIILTSDQGAIVTVNGGADLELVVQPAHGAALSRERRQCVSLSAVQRTAGERLGLHLQPRQRWRDHLSRLASGGGGGVRLRRARSARSGYRLRRQADALRPAHDPGAEHNAGARCQDQTSA